MVPLLIESLCLDNEQLIHSTLTTLKLLLETKHAIFSENIQCLIPRLLDLSTYKKMVIFYKIIKYPYSYYLIHFMLLNFLENQDCSFGMFNKLL